LTLVTFNRLSVMNDAEIRRLAEKMVERHGSEAAFRAIQHVNRNIDAGDIPERDRWLQIVQAIHILKRELYCTRIFCLAFSVIASPALSVSVWIKAAGVAAL